MSRFFNTAGPCEPADHYMLSPLRRLPDVRRFIDRKQYVVLHAPRQVGKTTSIRALAHELTAEGRYAGAYVSAEQGQAMRDDIGAAEHAILNDWRFSTLALPEPLRPPEWPQALPGGRIRSALATWAQACPRPLVLFIDEIDALRDDVLVSMLRQIRAGYPHRPGRFPWSIVLVGLRDVRDYEMTGEDEGRSGTASPFNIKVRSLTMDSFTREEVGELYGQHTAETGQRFEPEAVDRAFELTAGQPWLVNALADEIILELRPDPREAITRDDVERAGRVLIERQDTHLDSLGKRLREPRIRAIIEPMLAGAALGDIPHDDRRFAVDLGLVRISKEGGFEVANPIYREVIVRELASGPRVALPAIRASWLDAEGRLVPEALCDAFVAFWRQHGDAMKQSAPYSEVAAQLVLMAFLHRVVNGGGSIEREYAIGSGRMDLCVRMGDVRVAMELKVRRDGDHKGDPLVLGLAQLDRYLDGLGLETGWLVIFDQREGAEPTAVRTRREEGTSPGGRRVTVVMA